MSIQQLAAGAGISVRLVRDIEANHLYNIKISTAFRIAKALKVPAFIIFLCEEHGFLNEIIQSSIRRQMHMTNLESLFTMYQSLPEFMKGQYAEPEVPASPPPPPTL